MLAEQAAWIEARFVPERAQVRLRLAPALAPFSAQAARAARRWLDLDAAPAVIDSVLNGLSPAKPERACPARWTASSSPCAPCSGSA